MLRLFIFTTLLSTCVGSFITNSCHIAPSVVAKSGNLQQPQKTNVPKRRRKTIHLFSSTRDEEIAKLEAQLQQLRKGETSVISEDDNNVAARTTLDPDDVRTLQEFADARRRLEKVKGKDMILTEQELIQGGLMGDNSNSNFGGGAVPAVAVAIAALVGIIAFAQIPIGQENLARYSATGSSTLKSIDLGDLNPDVSNRL